MNSVRTRNLALAGAVAATVLAGGTTVAAASAPSPSGSTITRHDSSVTESEPGTEVPDGIEQDKQSSGAEEQGQEAADPSYTGSVKAPADREDQGGNEPDSSGSDESAEAAALARLATVDRAAAAKAATTAVPGTAGHSGLEDENGYVVWSVEVTRRDGSVVDVKVDAGDARVLAQDTAQDVQAGASG